MTSIGRRRLGKTLAAGMPLLMLGGRGAFGQTVPGAAWETIAPKAAGFDPAGFEALELELVTLPTTAFMVVSRGRVVYSYGDTAQVCYLASARKSILSMLYGKYVEKGSINLDRTMGELGIDEPDGLLPIEKTAKIRDLLIASSGVYHAAGSPGDDPNKIERGSKTPGTFFHYNNWDFNVLGAIFEKLTGKTVFAAMEQDLAKPLQFQDFDPKRQRMMGFENQSRYLAYHTFLSARDMARLGVVMANGGKWKDKQVVPAGWVQESTTEHVPADKVGRGGGLGYGYLWWIPETRTSAPWAGAYMASGQFGQFILVLPAIDTVIVHRRAVSDEYAVLRNLGKTTFEPTRVQAPDFLKLADKVVAAKIA
ncbi:MAG: serine hydrolase [Alphaproteobacteria bacterium]|nr:serine hydrolase [Alphaproteobacteria bacterium]